MLVCSQPPQAEVFQPAGGITYYSPQTQAVLQRPALSKRVKSAIPIVPPNEINNIMQQSAAMQNNIMQQQNIIQQQNDMMPQQQQSNVLQQQNDMMQQNDIMQQNSMMHQQQVQLVPVEMNKDEGLPN